MRQLKAIVCAVLIITFLLCSFSVASGINKNTLKIYVDSSGAYVCESDDYSVTIRNLKNSNQYKYSYANKVLSCCVTGGILFTLNSTNQPRVVLVTAAKNGKITKSVNVNIHNVPNNTRLCVDSDGFIYIFDNRNHAEVYNSKGSYIKTTSNAFSSLTQINGNVYASNSTGIYRLNGKSETLVCKCKADTFIYAVSKNCAATLYGNVYNLSSGKAVLNTDNEKPYSIALSSNYYIIIKNSKICVYNRKTLKFVNSYTVGYKPYAVCAGGSRVYVIAEASDGFSVNKYKERDFLPGSSTNNAKNSKSPTNINFGRYKTKGRYIFLPPRTTKAEFKEKIKYKDYKLKFSSTRGLGTNTKAVFTKGNKTYTYTIVVYGDITGTGYITKNDVNIMFNCLFGLDKVGGVYKTAADVNGDGKLSNVDLVMIDRKKDSLR
ncbi:MAG: dockerin type I repeat-containing protein [Ruminococcus sp.]|nr:dockerin type I repeat-containing protein [Ruminococcus sp.]